MSTTGPDPDALLTRVRSIALALPEVTERMSHGAPCFYVRRRPLCYFHDADFSADERTALWCPAAPDEQAHWVQRDPARYFAPTPSAAGTFADWVAAYLDGVGPARVDWDDITELIEAAFQHVAPRALRERLGGRPD